MPPKFSDTLGNSGMMMECPDHERQGAGAGMDGGEAHEVLSPNLGPRELDCPVWRATSPLYNILILTLVKFQESLVV